MEKYIVVGIYNQEIFIARVQENGQAFWDVLRPVSAERLERLRDESEIKEYCRDLWKQAVIADATEDSLDEYVQEIIDECGMDDDEEMYPGKDESDCQYLTEELRKEADDYLAEHEDFEVGTWESSGSYAPNCKWHNGDKKFTGFDYVFSTSEAQAQAKAFVDNLK